MLEEHRSVVRRMERGHMLYDDGPVRYSAVPILFWPQHWDLMSRTASALHGVLKTLVRLYHASDVVRGIVDLHPTLDELIRSRPPAADPLPVMRSDALWDGAAYRFVEFNTDSSAGMNDLTELEDYLLETPTCQELAKRWPLARVRLNLTLRATMHSCYRAWDGNHGAPPGMALVDWKGVDSEPEFRGLCEAFAQGGLPTIIADPSDLEIMNGVLHARGQPVNMLYKRVLAFELLDRPDASRVLFEAYRRNLCCQVGSFEGEIAYTKLSLAALTDPRVLPMLSLAEAAFVTRHIPWTRRLAEGKTDSAGKVVDLLPHLLAHRERYVIKPSNQYAGRRVTIGFDVDAATWETALRDALGRQSVVQEVVDIPEVDALFVGEAMTWTRLKFSVGKYILGGRFAGVYIRGAPGPVINVNMSGATIPTFRIAG